MIHPNCLILLRQNHTTILTVKSNNSKVVDILFREVDKYRMDVARLQCMPVHISKVNAGTL